MQVMVACASKHGATEGIALAIADRLRQQGHDAVAERVADVSDLHGVQAIVLGSAIYAGSWLKEAVEFAEGNAELLVDDARVALQQRAARDRGPRRGGAASTARRAHA